MDINMFVSFPIILLLLSSLVVGKVYELDSSSLKHISEGAWLIKFYAPWCGFCRRLEPVYQEVGEELSKVVPTVKVARIDVTANPGLGNHFGIRGYPTIKYINGSTQLTFTGDRTLNSIVTFVKRASGPPVTLISNTTEFNSVLQDHQDTAFFVFFGSEEAKLRANFNECAERMRLLTNFYTTSKDAIPILYSKHFTSADLQEGVVVVMKDGLAYKYPEDSRTLPSSPEEKETLSDWILRERVVAFPGLSEVELWQLGATLTAYQPPLVALFLVNQSEQDVNAKRFTELGRSMALHRLPRLFGRVQLAWSDDYRAFNQLAMTTLALPNLLVIDVHSQVFYLHPDYDNHQGLQHLTWEQLVNFFVDISEGRVKAYGGNTIPSRLYRMGYEFISGLTNFVTVAPVLALFVLGVPALVIAFFAYLCCCLDYTDEGKMEYHSVYKPAGDGPAHEHRWEDDASGSGDAPATNEQVVRRHRPSQFERNYQEIGPVSSKEEIEAKLQEFYESKKTK